MKKLLTLVLTLGVLAPQLQAKKPQSYYDNIVANCKKQSQADALNTLQALPFADQRIVLNMIAQGLAKNPKDLEFFLPLALSVHGNDRAWTRRSIVGSGLVCAVASFAIDHYNYKPKDLKVGDLPFIALFVASSISGLIFVGKLLSLTFSSTPAPLASHTFKALLKKAQGN